MREIVTCQQMKILDSHTIEKQKLPSCVLMERAALAVAEEMERFLTKEERVLVVCGNGNNGGDGVALARILALRGFDTAIFLVGHTHTFSLELSRQLEIADAYGILRVNNPNWSEYTTIVDAIFGVGLSRPVEGYFAEVIGHINASSAKKVAVDIPSGIHGDNGQMLGTAVMADLTVTFAWRKQGLCFYPGRSYAGKIVVADVGIYGAENIKGIARHLEPADCRLLPERRPDGNKGTFGKVLLVAGSPGMCGAAYLSAKASLRAGAGMVKIQTAKENLIPLQVLLPEAMVSCTFTEEENQRLLNWCDVIIIGPGLGMSEESRIRAKWFLIHGSKRLKPIVLDADGLNLLAEHPAWNVYLSDRVILTPHMGEMSRLTKKSIEEIKENPVNVALSYAEEANAVCVLKDSCTVIADAAGSLYLNLYGNAGMASAGSGDVLSGILAAMFCRYLSSEEEPDTAAKAAFGVLLHALAGDSAAEKLGKQAMTAQDIIKALSDVDGKRS